MTQRRRRGREPKKEPKKESKKAKAKENIQREEDRPVIVESRENIEDDKVEVPSDIAPPPPAFDNHTRPMKEEVTKLYCLLNIVEKEEYIILQCTMWLSFSKNGIRDSNQISTTAPIFLQFNYFRQNLEENVTFTFYFFSFASNFPCKIL